jgi:hypothetical protein
MDTLKDEIKNAKDYQLKACYNRMRELNKSCNDNLTAIISKTIQLAAEKEAKKRGLEIEYWI